MMPRYAEAPEGGASALVLALRDHAAVNSVERVGISALSELSGGGVG
jgi:hypothetical protein